MQREARYEMSIILKKTGTLSDFFDSLRQTAIELDNHQTITEKHTIWSAVREILSKNITSDSRNEI